MTEDAERIRAALTRRRGELHKLPRLEAVVEASRTAVLVVVPRLASAHDARVAQRGPARTGTALPLWRPREVVAIVALLIGLLAAALVLPSPRSGRTALDLDEGGIWVGVLAACSLLTFVALERGRRESRLLGPHTRTASRLLLVLAIVWALALVFVIVHWDEVDRFEPQLPLAGAVLLGASIVGAIVFSVVVRRHDEEWLRDPAIAAKDEWGLTAADADPVEEWWAALPLRLRPLERREADRSYETALLILEGERIIRPRDARRLRRKNPTAVWRGDAS